MAETCLHARLFESRPLGFPQLPPWCVRLVEFPGQCSPPPEARMIIQDVHGSRVPRRSVGAGRWVEAKIQPGLCSRGLWAQKECLFFFNSHKGNPRTNSSRAPWASWNSDSTQRASDSHSRPLKPYAALPRDPTSSHDQTCYFHNSPGPAGPCFF